MTIQSTDLIDLTITDESDFSETELESDREAGADIESGPELDSDLDTVVNSDLKGIETTGQPILIDLTASDDDVSSSGRHSPPWVARRWRPVSGPYPRNFKKN